MRILFTGLSGSIHLVRWIEQIQGRGWDIHLFPTPYFRIHPELKDVTVYDLEDPATAAADPSVRKVDRFGTAWGRSWRLPGRYKASNLVRRMVPQFDDQAWRLARLIDRLQPDIIHSLTLHRGGLPVLDAKPLCQKPFPTWIVSNWGSDLFLFGRTAKYRDRLNRILAECDYYWCECTRDVKLARERGFAGTILPVIPVAGGFDLDRARALRSSVPPSKRRTIVLKGYQDWAGRALTALYALRLCVDLLDGYKLVVYTGGRDPEAVEIAVELFSQDTGVEVETVKHVPHERMLEYHGRARTSIGVNISDAISISSLEAMMMGSFPIQSNTAAAGEWFIDGTSGILVPPEDPHPIADAIRRVLTDDALVDKAADINWKIISERLDRRTIAAQVADIYARIAAGEPVESL
ncbi:hypothetical protein JCM19992_01170 [Thermostilla marina]